MRLAEALNAATLLIDKNEYPSSCSSARRCNEAQHLIRAFNITREENEPGGPRCGEKRSFGRGEMRAR